MAADEHKEGLELVNSGLVTLEELFELELTSLAFVWKELGISPDDFLKCSNCHDWMFDENGNPRHHCGQVNLVKHPWKDAR